MSNNNYIAKTLFGLEEILAKELSQIGANKIYVSNRAVNFEADLKTLYKINLGARTALRVLFPIKSFTAKNPDQLYKKSKEYGWAQLISLNDTFLVDSVVNSNNFKHSKYAALKLKDAIVDKIRSQKGKRPNVDTKNPTFGINLHIDDEKCTISLDTSGESLHKRGYRLSGERAPLNEVLAAGMIFLSGWDKKAPFIDPMCGSGTLAIEAALMALNIPPNLNRNKFGFMNWKSFDKQIYQNAVTELKLDIKETCEIIIGNDNNSKSLISAKNNAKRASVDNVIKFTDNDFFKSNNSLESGTLICNPPYGERLKQEDIDEFYKKIGDTLKTNYNGFDAWVLSSNKIALKKLGLRTSRRLLLFNGALECKYHNYKLYKGSMKKKYE